MTDRFNNNQIIGVIADSPKEIDLAAQYGLKSVEIRVDLLLSSGYTVDQILQLISDSASRDFGVLATVRHPTHGGKYQESEQQRVALYQAILEAGADLIDVEWDSEAARQLLDIHNKLVLSYHNFSAMPTTSELSELSSSLEAKQPYAIKIVPTAANLADAARMLAWVNQSTASTETKGVRRIGFAMGAHGACSRILTTCFGGALTYASFGEAVAPGQVPLDQLIDGYRVPGLNQATRVTAVVAQADSTRQSPSDLSTSYANDLNLEYKKDNSNRVAIDFSLTTSAEVESNAQVLRIDEVKEV